ncbi:collagen-like triple helix repeat-containing protein, partial [Pedobacter sp. ASV12]|uniref:collagen-like triple helix repeat-containing protein n=1 Tax=Pedobacter sp. ASV12 TaxID=2795120 RepID=UPI0018EBA055
MKKTLLIAFSLLLCISIVSAQQKIKDGTINNTNLPNKDALLDLESNNKGLLHARVSLVKTSDAAPLTAHVAGMMVYNTATINDVVPGIYYDDGSKWIFVKSAPGTINVEGQPGKTGAPGTPGQPGGPGAGVTIVTNDSGTWVYNPTTNTWTNINGPKGDKGDKGDAGVVGVQGLPGTSGTPGTPGSGQPGAPGAGI